MVPIIPLELSQTLALRRAVLRGGDPDADVVVDTDRAPGCRHLGIVVDDEVVATLTAFPSSPPHHAQNPGAQQLRFMAVSPEHQGSGLGRALLLAMIDELWRAGATLIWANARDSALGFYQRLGFSVLAGSAFTSASTNLPHHVVELERSDG